MQESKTKTCWKCRGEEVNLFGVFRRVKVSFEHGALCSGALWIPSGRGSWCCRSRQGSLVTLGHPGDSIS